MVYYNILEVRMQDVAVKYLAKKGSAYAEPKKYDEMLFCNKSIP